MGSFAGLLRTPVTEAQSQADWIESSSHLSKNLQTGKFA